jgi:hypothetical protein
VLLEASPGVLLCANITYYIVFEFDPVKSKQAPPPSQEAYPSLMKSTPIIVRLYYRFMKAHLFLSAKTTTHSGEQST